MLKELFKPVEIGGLKLKNRIVMPAMVTDYADPLGGATQRLIDYHVARARGGVGLQIVEAADITGERMVGRLTIHSDYFIPGLRDLTEAVQEWGGRIAIQLNHTGLRGNLPGPDDLTAEEIEQRIEAFVAAAVRAEAAGFDAVEFHGAHGYLISSFLSPLTNHRNDRFGGDLLRRTTFATEVLRRARGALGPNFPIIFRYNGSDYIEGGLTVDDAEAIAPLLSEAGADALHISAGVGIYASDTSFRSQKSYRWMVPPMAFPRGCLVPLAAQVKRSAKVPVIAVGRINDVLLAEEILAQGQADLVAMGRALLADPDLPRKAAAGQRAEIRKCFACMWCHRHIRMNYRLRCAVNAATGREREFALVRTSQPKRVLVVGGGPAGLEAARVLAERGHRAMLYDQNPRLGGQLALAARPPHKEEINEVAAYLVHQVTKLGIEVKLGVKVTPSLVAQLMPDAVVVATGAQPELPDIPGLDQPHVVVAQQVLTMENVPGQQVVLVGGGYQGCETAEWLAQQGKRVSLVGRRENLAFDAEPITQEMLVERLQDRGVALYPATEAKEIRPRSVVVANRAGEAWEIEADLVVLAVGLIPDQRLVEELRPFCGEIYAIGDCVEPKGIGEAIHAGAWAARQI